MPPADDPSAERIAAVLEAVLADEMDVGAAVLEMADFLEDDDPIVRERALRGLVGVAEESPDETALALATVLEESENDRVRRHASETLATVVAAFPEQVPRESLEERLQSLHEDRDPVVGFYAGRMLAALESEQPVLVEPPFLVSMLDAVSDRQREEYRELAASVAEEAAADSARDVAAGVARDESASAARAEAREIASETAETVARETAKGVAEDVARRTSDGVAREVASSVAREEAESTARQQAESVARDAAESVARKEAASVAREEAERVVDGRLAELEIPDSEFVTETVDDRLDERKVVTDSSLGGRIESYVRTNAGTVFAPVYQTVLLTGIVVGGLGLLLGLVVGSLLVAGVSLLGSAFLGSAYLTTRGGSA